MGSNRRFGVREQASAEEKGLWVGKWVAVASGGRLDLQPRYPFFAADEPRGVRLSDPSFSRNLVPSTSTPYLLRSLASAGGFTSTTSASLPLISGLFFKPVTESTSPAANRARSIFVFGGA